ncbi:hypothetical protein Tco_0756240 [Tanacetum coccineum]
MKQMFTQSSFVLCLYVRVIERLINPQHRKQHLDEFVRVLITKLNLYSQVPVHEASDHVGERGGIIGGFKCVGIVVSVDAFDVGWTFALGVSLDVSGGTKEYRLLRAEQTASLCRDHRPDVIALEKGKKDHDIYDGVTGSIRRLVDQMWTSIGEAGVVLWGGKGLKVAASLEKVTPCGVVRIPEDEFSGTRLLIYYPAYSFQPSKAEGWGVFDFVMAE